MAEAAGKADVLLFLRKAGHVAQDNNPVYLKREADRQEALGVGRKSIARVNAACPGVCVRIFFSLDS